jgi:hypothetical protein
VQEFKGVPGEWQLFAARLSERAGISRRVRLLTQDTKVQALKRAPLFEGLSRKELVLLARVTEDLEVPAGEVLCREGETGQEFFVITALLWSPTVLLVADASRSVAAANR